MEGKVAQTITKKKIFLNYWHAPLRLQIIAGSRPGNPMDHRQILLSH